MLGRRRGVEARPPADHAGNFCTAGRDRRENIRSPTGVADNDAAPGVRPFARRPDCPRVAASKTK